MPPRNLAALPLRARIRIRARRLFWRLAEAFGPRCPECHEPLDDRRALTRHGYCQECWVLREDFFSKFRDYDR